MESGDLGDFAGSVHRGSSKSQEPGNWGAVLGGELCLGVFLSFLLCPSQSWPGSWAELGIHATVQGLALRFYGLKPSHHRGSSVTVKAEMLECSPPPPTVSPNLLGGSTPDPHGKSEEGRAGH